MIRRFLEWLGLIHPLAVPTRPVKRKVTPKPQRKAKAKPVSHAAAVKVELLNAVADALGRAPAELDPLQPKATIAVNGSLFTITNTVDALSAFQSRLEKLQTTPGKTGVPLAARKLPVYAPSLGYKRQKSTA